MERAQLKEMLQKIADNDYNWFDSENPKDYIDSFCHYIGDTDPVLRDDLIYPIFGGLTEDQALLPNEDAANLTCLLSGSDYLSFSLGLEADDSVFKRTFSALILACLLDRDIDAPFLNDAERRLVGERLLKTFKGERDIRSYIPEKGWAHSLAHYSDMIGCFLKNSQTPQTYLPEFMNALSDKLSEKQGVWSGEEDERWVTALAKPFFESTTLNIETATEWVQKMGNALENVTGHERNSIAINNKHFLRSLYFRGLKYYPEHPMLSPIFEAQEKINRHIDYI
jgi:hypothetical protein